MTELEKCPQCGDENIYKSFFSTECTTKGCENYSETQKEIIMELENSVVTESPDNSDGKDPATVPMRPTPTTAPCAPGYPTDTDMGWLIPPIT